MKAIQLIVPLILGIIIPLQAISNAKLGAKVGHPLWGAVSNFVVAFICIMLFIFLTGAPKPNFEDFQFKHIPYFFGGLVGAFYIFCSLFFVPKMGGLVFFSTVIVVQLIASLIYDHYGVLGITQTITAQKVFGVCLLIAGTFCIIK